MSSMSKMSRRRTSDVEGTYGKTENTKACPLLQSGVTLVAYLVQVFSDIGCITS